MYTIGQNGKVMAADEQLRLRVERSVPPPLTDEEQSK
jgi:hypothetical protein